MNASKKEFIAEAEDLLQESQSLILEIQDTYSSGINPVTINALFRAMHTLKGVSRLFGLISRPVPEREPESKPNSLTTNHP